MTVLYITEYADVRDNAGYEPATANQKLSFTTTTQSNAFNADTKIIRVHTPSICSIEVGVNPTATTSSKRMAAGQTEYFMVKPGHILAAVDNT